MSNKIESETAKSLIEKYSIFIDNINNAKESGYYIPKGYVEAIIHEIEKEHNIELSELKDRVINVFRAVVNNPKF